MLTREATGLIERRASDGVDRRGITNADHPRGSGRARGSGWSVRTGRFKQHSRLWTKSSVHASWIALLNDEALEMLSIDGECHRSGYAEQMFAEYCASLSDWAQEQRASSPVLMMNPDVMAGCVVEGDAASGR